MRITAGMIVLNGEPFVGHSLRAIYDFADEIIVIEGAVENAMFAARPDGSSADRTVEIIRALPDPDRKITLVQGRWRDKVEQSNAYLARATGDYVWQVDSDEMYLPEDLAAVRAMLNEDPAITMVTFYCRPFWHNLHTQLVGPPWETVYRRVFKRVPGARFVSHRPPTVVGADGRDLATLRMVRANEMRRRGLFMFHYSFVDPEQVRRKIEYYRRLGFACAGPPDWYDRVYMGWLDDPAAVEEKYGTYPTGGGWTTPYRGLHPPAMNDHPHMQRELEAAPR
jgi:glycosyltransferase involved in cell wall biosynthesis